MARAAVTPRVLQTAAGCCPSTAQMVAVISLADATMAWVMGLVGMARSPTICDWLWLASTAGEKLDPTST